MMTAHPELTGSMAGDGASTRVRWTLGLVCLIYAAATLSVLPYASLPGPVVPTLTTTFGMGVLIADLCTGFLLLAQFRAAPSWPMLLLAGAYFYSGAMALLHVLSFPGAWIADTVLLGTPQTVGWLFIAWILGFPMLVITAVVAEARSDGRLIAPERADRAVVTVFLSVSGVVAALTLMAVTGERWLPEQLQGNVFASWGRVAQWSSVGLSAVAFVVVMLVVGSRNVLYDWLGFALIAFMAFNALAASGGARYTIGWDLSRVSGLVSASLLLVFFLGQFSKLHQSLARAHRRLRDANDTLERRVAERTAELATSNEQLRKALHESSLLLREVYHRVKNNLQVIDSLIAIEMSGGLGQTPPEQVLSDLRQRINALGLVHQQLMTSPDLTTFDIRPFLDELRRNLLVASGGDRQGITLSVEADPLPVDLDFAIPLGLLVTELVSNALKHAFPDGRGGAVRVLLRRGADGTVLLSVTDNGRIHEPAAGTKVGGNGFGLTIVEGLVAQLEGEMTSRKDVGTTVEIRIPLPGAASS